MLDGDFEDVPLVFAEKQMISVSIPNAFLFESDRISIPYTYCEVYAPAEVTTNVCDGGFGLISDIDDQI